MRRKAPRRQRAVAALAALGALAVGLAGAGPLSAKKKPDKSPVKVEECVGDLAYITNSGDTKLEGVGLVVGLDNTGADPPPSYYRSKLLDDMRKEGVENPNQILKSAQVSMVVVKMTVPPGVSPSDRLDAEVEVAPAGGTKSLAGGYLLRCRLRQVMLLGGAAKEGADAAVVQGPVLVEGSDDPTKGRILGGARVKREAPHRLVLKDNRKSFRNSSMLEGVVNQRFPQTEGVNQRGSATAKTDEFLILKIPQVYHQNQDRFCRVVKLLPMVDSPGLRAERLAKWGKELQAPGTAGIAALKLEGLGGGAADTLKAALANDNAQVRFLAAESLAYLNDPAGAEQLARTAVEDLHFRAYALAALAAMDQPASHVKLRNLMDEPEVTVRYGAFNALRTLDKGDPFLGQVRVLDLPDEPDPDGAGDGMAVAITRASAQKRKEDPFDLYLVDCEGPPMIHVARTRRCEIVVFGRGQQLLTPVVLGTGPYLLNASDGDDKVEVSRIVTSRLGDGDDKVAASLEMGDVLRRAANLGAKYPELVTILQAAERQKNLPGPLVVDALPGTSPVYLDAVIAGKDTKAKKDDALKRTKAEDEKSKHRSIWDRLFGRDKDD